MGFITVFVVGKGGGLVTMGISSSVLLGSHVYYYYQRLKVRAFHGIWLVCWNGAQEHAAHTRLWDGKQK